jgi:hypothetical protein
VSEPNEPTPTDVDPDGSWYCFERGATKTTGGKGWADVWKRECFGWEYKGKHKDLTAAFVQLQRYALALENPPFRHYTGLIKPSPVAQILMGGIPRRVLS